MAYIRANEYIWIFHLKAFFAQLEMGPVSDEVRELSAQTISRVRGSDEAREGFDAFLDKRPPNWIAE